MPKSLANANPTRWRFEVAAIRITATPVAMSTLLSFHRFRGILGCDFVDAVRFQTVGGFEVAAL